MSSQDASVSVLMNRMGEVEKQRRVLCMHLKELEAKVAFATAEKADLAREATAMDEEETQLKAELEALATEDQQLDLQTVEVLNTLRRTEAEEAVQTTAAVTEQQTLERERAAWREKVAELETLRRTWEEDPVTSTCLAGVRETMAALASLTTKKVALEAQRAEVEEAVEKMRAEQQARLACAVEMVVALPSSSAADQTTGAEEDASASAAGTTPNVDEEIQRVEYDWAQVTARHSWTMSSLQREVDALSSRAAELQELLASVRATRQELSRRADQLRQCLTNSCCLRCPQ